MSRDCEPSELTPLRRNNQFRRQQVQQQPEQQQQPWSHQLHIDHPQDIASGSNHLQSDDFIEYMSINNNNHPIGSESSRGDTSEPNSQQAFNPKSFMMSDTRRVLTRVTIDFIILLCGESFYYFNFHIIIKISYFSLGFLIFLFLNHMISGEIECIVICACCCVNHLFFKPLCWNGDFNSLENDKPNCFIFSSFFFLIKFRHGFQLILLIVQLIYLNSLNEWNALGENCMMSLSLSHCRRAHTLNTVSS